MTIGIYQILNTTNNKRYIGQSVNIEQRLSTHKSELKNNKHRNLYLQKAYNKQTNPSFIFQPLVECSVEHLDFYEDLLIQSYKSNTKNAGYNLRTVTTSNAGIVTSRNKHKAGDKYFRLTLIKPSCIAGDQGSWVCQCECGEEVIVRPSQIIRGHNKSCGCLNKEKQIKRHEKIAGTKYNRWTLIEKIETRKGCAWWLAKCQCGTTRVVNTKYLLNGESKSCGCYKSEATTLRNLTKKEIFCQ